MYKNLLIAAILLTSVSCFAQDFDRTAEKAIKTEINLNRIAKSQNPLSLTDYYKKSADSLNTLLYKEYLKTLDYNAVGHQVDDVAKAWPVVMKDWEQKYASDFNVLFLVVRDGDYKSQLKTMAPSKAHSIYKLDESMVSVSAIRHNDTLIITLASF